MIYGLAERFGKYILEQFVSVGAVPELIVGRGEGMSMKGGGSGSLFPVFHTSGQTMQKYAKLYPNMSVFTKAQVTRRRISHGYNPASFVPIRIGCSFPYCSRNHTW